MKNKDTMLTYAIQQITGFQQALSSTNARFLASGMGLTQEEWEQIKSTETWIDKRIVDDIDGYFEEESDV